MHQWFNWFGLGGKFVLTVLLSATALVLALAFRGRARWTCFAAMLCSTMGDLILTNWRGLGDRLPLPSFYVGMACFVAAHVLYAAAFGGLVKRQGKGRLNPGFWLAAVCAAAGAAAVIAPTLRLPRVDWILFAACFLYLLIIGWMLTNVFSLAWSARGLRIVTAVGAFSFFVSDLIIGLDELAHVSTYNEGIWWLYPIGQLLMLLFVTTRREKRRAAV